MIDNDSLNFADRVVLAYTEAEMNANRDGREFPDEVDACFAAMRWTTSDRDAWHSGTPEQEDYEALRVVMVDVVTLKLKTRGA